MSLITYDTMGVLAFVRQFYPLPAMESMQGLGLQKDGQLVAGVLYEGFNGHAIWMHVAAIPGRSWLNRRYLKVCFGYPFVQLGVKAVFGWVPEENHDARRFDEHLGFRQVSTIPGAGRDGGDVLVYRMNREECRYVDPA